MIRLVGYTYLGIIFICNSWGLNCIVDSDNSSEHIIGSVELNQEETGLLETILTSEREYLRDFVHTLIKKEVETIGITGVNNFQAKSILVKGHKFYLVSSNTPEYQINVHFQGDHRSGFFEFGNSRYATTGKFDQVGTEWQLSNLFPMNMD